MFGPWTSCARAPASSMSSTDSGAPCRPREAVVRASARAPGGPSPPASRLRRPASPPSQTELATPQLVPVTNGRSRSAESTRRSAAAGRRRGRNPLDGSGMPSSADAPRVVRATCPPLAPALDFRVGMTAEDAAISADVRPKVSAEEPRTPPVSGRGRRRPCARTAARRRGRRRLRLRAGFPRQSGRRREPDQRPARESAALRPESFAMIGSFRRRGAGRISRGAPRPGRRTAARTS